jgi:hypothetical protein
MLFIDPMTDLVHTLQYINDYTKSIGVINVEIDINKIKETIASAQQDGHYSVGGVAKASAFRKLASFISFFIALRPIINAFPEDKIGEDLYRINNHQNIIIALSISMDSLYGAKIYRDDGEFELSNPIKISDHSYVDIVDALSGVTPSNGMKMVAVLLEQMAYKQNPQCEYLMSRHKNQ